MNVNIINKEYIGKKVEGYFSNNWNFIKRSSIIFLFVITKYTKVVKLLNTLDSKSNAGRAELKGENPFLSIEKLLSQK
jgi:hypothetical protein